MKIAIILPLACIAFLSACNSNDKPVAPPAQVTNEITGELECDQPGRRDDQGRPIPQC